MISPRRSSDGGFTLTEIICIFGLMGVAALLAGRLFSASMRVIDQAPAAQDALSRMERLCAVLRWDVWGAAKIDLPDPRTIILTRRDGAVAQWRFEDRAAIRSEAGRGAGGTPREQRWSLSQPLTAERHGPAVVLAGERWFTSQLISAEARP